MEAKAPFYLLQCLLVVIQHGIAAAMMVTTGAPDTSGY